MLQQRFWYLFPPSLSHPFSLPLSLFNISSFTLLPSDQVNISKVQDDEVGDGTTSVCVLAAELLREGERLINKKIHPQTIIKGYRLASEAALKALESVAMDNRYFSLTFNFSLSFTYLTSLFYF